MIVEDIRLGIMATIYGKIGCGKGFSNDEARFQR